MAGPTHNLQDELAAVLSVADEVARLNALTDLAPRLPEDLLSKALDATTRFQDKRYQAFAIGALAPHLSEEQLDAAVRLALNIEPFESRNEALGRLGPFLAPEYRENIISLVMTQGSELDVRLKAWVGLAEYLPTELKQEALTTALTLTDPMERSEALVALAPHLPDVWKLRVLDSVKQIQSPILRSGTLVRLLSALPTRARAEALDEAWTAARSVPSAEERVVALANLYPHVPDRSRQDLTDEALSTARSAEDFMSQVSMLTDIAYVFDVDPLSEALKAANQITIEGDRMHALLQIATWAPRVAYLDLVKAAEAIKDTGIKSKTIIRLDAIFEERERSAKATDTEPLVTPVSTPQAVKSFAPDDGEDEEVEEPPAVRVSPAQAQEAGPAAGARGTVPPKRKTAKQVEEAEDPAQAVPVLAPEADKEEKPVETPPVGAAQELTAGVLLGDSGTVTPKPGPAKQDEDAVAATESVAVATYLHSDRWTLDDQLGYSLYADAIAEFIRHADTKPPLTIGVLAPWGQGKTTLMHLIRFHLYLKANNLKSGTEDEVKFKEEFSRKMKTEPQQKPVTSFGTLKEWLSELSTPALKKIEYPTVWFNAWKYQNSEQVWAGMAHTILSQLVDQIDSPIEREKFWLALQAERIDFNAVRKDIYRIVFERFAPRVARWAVIGVVGVLLFALSIVVKVESLASVVTSAIIGGGGGVAVIASLLKLLKEWNQAADEVAGKRLEGKFAQYVRQPNYESKLGYFHEVEQDVRRVFDLLVDEKNPVVVFVDDLDRCSPGTVAQVIEAMNLFLSGDFPNCYFVIGMDAQVVAASMEVAYTNLDQRLRAVTRSYGSLGWYFLDKFIQLQFCIPNMTGPQRSSYLNGLFGRRAAPAVRLSPQALDQVVQQVKEKLEDENAGSAELKEQGREVAKLLVQRPTQWKRLSHQIIEEAAKKLSDDSPDLQKHLQRYEPSLGSSPRTIKRFANLYRFYSLTQLSRQSQGLQTSSAGALARWLVIMLRWPQLVRWIQWEGEANLGAGTNPLEKATSVEQVVGASASYEEWIGQLTDATRLEWLNDKQLYQFLKSHAADNERLSRAVETGVW